MIDEPKDLPEIGFETNKPMAFRAVIEFLVANASRLEIRAELTPDALEVAIGMVTDVIDKYKAKEDEGGDDVRHSRM